MRLLLDGTASLAEVFCSFMVAKGDNGHAGDP
jgi:hypothetical protein